MPFFKVYGKRYHREHADYFDEIIKARSPQAALFMFALSTTGLEHSAEVEWDGEKPDRVRTGWLEPKPAFWVGEDEIYQIRKISVVTSKLAECPACRGSGKAQSYFEVEAVALS